QQRGGPDPIPWSETAPCQDRSNRRPCLQTSFLFLFFSMLAGPLKSVAQQALNFTSLNFRPKIATNWEAQIFSAWEGPGKFVWLVGFCALLVLLIACLLRLK